MPIPSSRLFIACTSKLNIHKFHVLPTQCIYVFCVDLRTNSDYFPIQHWLVFVTETEITARYELNSSCVSLQRCHVRRLIVGLSPHRPVFGSGPLVVRFVVDKLTQAFIFEYFAFLLSLLLHQCSIFRGPLIPLTPKGQGSQSLGTCQHLPFRVIGVALDIEVLSDRFLNSLEVKKFPLPCHRTYL